MWLVSNFFLVLLKTFLETSRKMVFSHSVYFGYTHVCRALFEGRNRLCVRFLSAFIEKITRLLYTGEGEYKIQLHMVNDFLFSFEPQRTLYSIYSTWFNSHLYDFDMAVNSASKIIFLNRSENSSVNTLV